MLAEPEPGYSIAVSDFVVSLPDALDGIWRIFADVPMVWSAVILIGARSVTRSIARDMVLAVVVGVVLWLLLARTVTGEWPDL